MPTPESPTVPTLSPTFTLLSAGSNAQGQLANSTTEDSHTLQPCTFDGYPPGTLPTGTQSIECIAAGANHTLALLTIDSSSASKVEGDGGYRALRRELWGCGTNSKGQLGPSINASGTLVFQPISFPLSQLGLVGSYTPRLIAAAWETSYIALSSDEPSEGDDILISMGANDYGDLGIGPPVQATPNNNKRSTRGRNVAAATREPSSSTTKPFHVVSFSPLTLPDGLSLENCRRLRILQLEAGQHHVVVQFQVELEDNSTRQALAGWGTARHGQLGSLTPVQAILATPTIIPKGISDSDVVSMSLGSQHTLLLHEDGQVTALGTNRKGQIEGLTSLKNVIKVGCAWNGSFAVVNTSPGEPVQILSTGSSTHGQLGSFPRDGTPVPLQPVNIPPVLPSDITMACGSEHVLVVLKTQPDGAEVWGWGWNEHGNLGLGNTEDVFLPTRIWPKTSDERIQVHGIWAGCGTTWICCTSNA